ncbi:hypothetical protein HDE_12236 [Halotydeus destructor]|nr:hypothetical protein HDE_12236 [Halotydeus destructor]
MSDCSDNETVIIDLETDNEETSFQEVDQSTIVDQIHNFADKLNRTLLPLRQELQLVKHQLHQANLCIDDKDRKSREDEGKIHSLQNQVARLDAKLIECHKRKSEHEISVRNLEHEAKIKQASWNVEVLSFEKTLNEYMAEINKRNEQMKQLERRNLQLTRELDSERSSSVRRNSSASVVCLECELRNRVVRGHVKREREEPETPRTKKRPCNGRRTN